MPTEKIYNNLLKGEHFHKNNADMKLDFAKPSKAEIDEMNYKKPITSYESLPDKPFKLNEDSGNGLSKEGFSNIHTLEYLGRVKDLPNDSSSITKREE
jgi:hypothetical protein|tara:strand:- start:65 stop:358 length:294 start_codon:yes stop_codon:yes gene_type:complete